MPKQIDIEAILRSAIEQSGMTVTELAKQADVSHTQLYRFMKADRTLTLPVASRLFYVLGLRVTKD